MSSVVWEAEGNGDVVRNQTLFPRIVERASVHKADIAATPSEFSAGPRGRRMPRSGAHAGAGMSQALAHLVSRPLQVPTRHSAIVWHRRIPRRPVGSAEGRPPTSTPPVRESSQSMWNTSRRSFATGLLSGLDGMISPMCFHHRWHASVCATPFQRSSSSIST